MSRERKQVWSTTPLLQVATTYKCDKCGAAIDPDAYDGTEANELLVLLNDGQCVSFGHRRDLCTSCLTPVWETICAALGADPDSEEKTGFEDE